MGQQGAVAVGNLVLLGLVALANWTVFSQRLPFGRMPDSRQGLAMAFDLAVAVLAFPVGWLSNIFSTVSGPPIVTYTAATIFLPLNAYLWGYVWAAVRRRTRRATFRPPR